eukprot:Nk52_evm4s503 gene=Nk52_evmTU4s503
MKGGENGDYEEEGGVDVEKLLSRIQTLENEKQFMMAENNALQGRLDKNIETVNNERLNNAELRKSMDDYRKQVIQLTEDYEELNYRIKEMSLICGVAVDLSRTGPEAESSESFISKSVKALFEGDELVVDGKSLFRHNVKNSSGVCCGSILYYESQTKTFQVANVEKMQDAMKKRRSGFGVIVSKSLPRDFTFLKHCPRIYVTTEKDFEAHFTVLREALIRLHMVHIGKVHDESKETELFQYLEGDLFQNQIRAILASTGLMLAQLESEKASFVNVHAESALLTENEENERFITHSYQDNGAQMDEGA